MVVHVTMTSIKTCATGDARTGLDAGSGWQRSALIESTPSRGLFLWLSMECSHVVATKLVRPEGKVVYNGA